MFATSLRKLLLLLLLLVKWDYFDRNYPALASARRVDQGNETYLGDENLLPTLQHLSEQTKGHAVMLITDMRYDGAGAEILQMILFAAYAELRGWIYAGAIRRELRVSYVMRADITTGLDYVC